MLRTDYRVFPWLKHLPGEHDQHSHAGGSSTIAESDGAKFVSGRVQREQLQAHLADKNSTLFSGLWKDNGRATGRTTGRQFKYTSPTGTEFELIVGREFVAGRDSKNPRLRVAAKDRMTISAVISVPSSSIFGVEASFKVIRGATDSREIREKIEKEATKLTAYVRQKFGVDLIV